MTPRTCPECNGPVGAWPDLAACLRGHGWSWPMVVRLYEQCLTGDSPAIRAVGGA